MPSTALVFLQLMLPALQFSGIAVAGDLPASPDSTWHTYVNAKYGYSIRYPDGYELCPTGWNGETDGATIRIAVRYSSAYGNLLDVVVCPGAPMEAGAPPGQTETTITRVRDERLDGAPIRVEETRWKKDGSLGWARIYREGAVFDYLGGNGVSDIQDTVWWQIVSSFTFIEKNR
jgi:hypothetical protein